MMIVTTLIVHSSPLLYLKANKGHKVVKDFRLALRRAQHAAIFDCFRQFNKKGGAVVPLQSGGSVYSARAIILAIYGDQQAARKCTLTGSSCPVCYTPETKMSRLEQEPRYALLRTPKNMRNRKRILRLMANQPGRGQKDLAQKRAKRIGVNLDVTSNAFEDDSDASVSEKVMGPDPEKDNVHQITPQVTLHGMDEGLTNKTNHGVLEATIKEASYRWGISATEVHARYIINVLHYVHYNDHYNEHCDDYVQCSL